MDLDIGTEGKLPTHLKEVTLLKKKQKHEKWKKANEVWLMIMQRSTLTDIHGGFPTQIVENC